MKTSASILLLWCVTLLGNPRIVTAQSSDTSDFDRRIDAIVNETFQRFDERFGTYIFTDEPSNTERADSSEPCDLSSQKHDDQHGHHWLTGEQSSMYGNSQSSFIHRNSTILFPWYPMNDDILFRYNRVEGLFLGLNFPKKYRWEDHHVNLFSSLGYGFAEHRWRYGGGIANQIGMGKSLFEVGVEGHSLTDTRDQWLVDDGENNLAALLARDDYRDYYGREGVSLWTAYYLRSNCSDAQFRVAYLNDMYNSLDRNTGWSLFGGDKVFRENPRIDDGSMRSILVSMDYHNAGQRRYMTTGWSASASAEIAGRAFRGDFDFNRYVIDVRRYQPISDLDNINVRMRAASATGNVPLQKAFELGGISTLPAFTYKEFTGNRALLANAEYVVNGKLFDEDGIPAWLLRNFNLIVFFDAGYVAVSSTDGSFLDGFSGIRSNTVKSDWGCGVGTRDANMRLGFAWRTDVAEPVKVFLRIDRPF